MKMRYGFVSNSSSSSFVITNISKENKTLVDFVKENPQLIEQFREEYDWYKKEDGYDQENLIKSAEENNIFWKPGEIKECIFGDESQVLTGCVFDYILRDGGESKSFTWEFHESLR
jgi:hypothetical protein